MEKLENPKIENRIPSQPVRDEGTQSYDLKASVSGVGELVPVLVDASGNCIDGNHRKEVDPNWKTITLQHINNPVLLELARLAVNFCRRRLPSEELQNKIVTLVQAGLTPEEIADKTGISISTIYRHLPNEFKNQQRVMAGKASGFVRNCEQKVKISDNTIQPPLAEEETESAKHTPPSEKSEKKGKKVKLIDLEAKGQNCPCCGATISMEKYEILKKKLSKFEGLFA